MPPHPVPVPRQAATHERSPAAARTARVLIIEDNREAAEGLSRFLRPGCGHDVALAFDGASGVARALADPPEVVVWDIGLPKKNGILVGEELIESLPHRPLLIAVAGYGDAATRGLAAEAGFDQFLTKPADSFAIDAFIQAHLEAAGTTGE